MALTTTTVLVQSTWTLVSSEVSAMVFNDAMEVFITHGGMPAVTDQGFMVEAGTDYRNCSPNINIYARSKEGGTGVESVRIVKDVV